MNKILDFLDYQIDFINDPAPLKILEKSRRIGGTFAVAYSVFTKLMTIHNHDFTVVTRDMATAGEFVRDVQKFAKVYNGRNPDSAIPKECFTKMSFKVPHPDGESRLLVVSSNPDAAAGKGGSLILDEMALHKDPELLLTVAMPVITAGGSVTILSTHRSKNSAFNRLIKDTKLGKLNFSLHKATIYDAVEQGFVEKVVNPKRHKQGMPELNREEFIEFIKNDVCLGDEARFDQEYMCIPSEQQYNLIAESLCEDAIGTVEYDPSKPSYLGWDIATSEDGDYSAIIIVQFAEDNGIKMVYNDARKGEMLEDQRSRIVQLVKEYRVTKMALDATGIGRDSAQILVKKYGDFMCEGVNFSMQTKDEMAGRMLSIFQSKKITIPNDDKLIVDIHSMEKVYSAAGNVTYHAPRVDGSHGDRFWALGLSLRAAGWKRNGSIIKPLQSGQNTDQMAPDYRESLRRDEEEDRQNEKRKRSF